MHRDNQKRQRPGALQARQSVPSFGPTSADTPLTHADPPRVLAGATGGHALSQIGIHPLEEGGFEQRSGADESHALSSRPAPAPPANDRPLVTESAHEHVFSHVTEIAPQTKLTVNQPGDALEQEADAVADAVADTATGQVETAASNAFEESLPARRHDRRTGGRLPVRSVLAQRATGSADSLDADVSDAVQHGLSGGGQPLAAATRSDMERRLGHDFSNVRIHSDARASESASALRARAFTLGGAIAFRAGEYSPDAAHGRHLLAHELTHVIQQGAAQPLARQPSPMPAPAAHAPVRPAQAQVVQRDTPPIPPYAGPAPANPFPAPSTDKKLDVTHLVTSSMQSLASDMINHAYTSYLSAVATVKAKLQGEKREQEEKDKATRELVLGLVLLPLDLAAPAIGAAAVGAIPGVRNTLMKRIETTMPNLLKSNGLKPEDAVWATAQAASDLDGLIAKVSPEKVAEGVKGLGEKAKGAASKVTLNGGPFDQAQAFLDACSFAADQNSKALMGQVFVTSDFSELLGIYNTFSSASLEVYTADLDGRAHHFMTELSTTPGKVESIVELSAYGRDRLAKVRYNTTSANYFFIAWITPDMEPIARQLQPNPTRLPNSMIVNHLPVPMEETGERIVMVDAWGKDRLALVMVEEGKTGAGRADEVTQYQFVKWFGPTDEVMARTKGAQQIGGVNRLRPDQVRKLQAPTEPGT